MQIIQLIRIFIQHTEGGVQPQKDNKETIKLWKFHEKTIPQIYNKLPKITVRGT